MLNDLYAVMYEQTKFSSIQFILSVVLYGYDSWSLFLS